MEDLLALGAFIISVLSAWFSWYTSQQSRRQADAVMGDLPPVVSLFQPDSRGRAFAIIDLEVINYNRLPLYVDKIEFDIPEGLRIFKEHTEERQTMLSIMDAIVHGNRAFVFDLPRRISGSHPSAPPNVLSDTFKVATSNSQTPSEPFDASCTVWVRTDGEDTATVITKAITWRPLRLLDEI